MIVLFGEFCIEQFFFIDGVVLLEVGLDYWCCIDVFLYVGNVFVGDIFWCVYCIVYLGL